MERRAIMVCFVVSFLGVLSAATGFAAEATRIKRTQVEFPSPNECIYPRSPSLALPLGLASAVSLMIARIIIHVATGCICFKTGTHQSISYRTIELIGFVSWFTFVIAFILLLTGAALNVQHGDETLYMGDYYCHVVKPGAFAGAAVLSLASVVLSIIYYVTSTSTKSVNAQTGATAPPCQGGIAMGQPHIPPKSQDPVFVHEDTYTRRQFT
ncbi:hypothetical protein Leryth_004640 [Lithospermum erythrorhizon]|uniref:Uncharacterized protein n=1 Tax=Lithospermum erythrorhizon TaxID=34254 RepID=A0AAV3QX94_LITER|nr:hypothetical protein Leryth_004640 [Lithospermum erythrorhizon]